MTTPPEENTPAQPGPDPPLWWNGSAWVPVAPVPAEQTRNTPSPYAAMPPPAPGAYAQTPQQPWSTMGVQYGAPAPVHGGPAYPGGPVRQPGMVPVERPRSRRLDVIIASVAVIATLAVAFNFYLGDSGVDLPFAGRDEGFIEIDAPAPRGSYAAATLEEAEMFASVYFAERDDDDSYLEAGQQLARFFGAELEWGNYSDPDLCWGTHGHGAVTNTDDDTAVVAWFCELEPYVIRLNRESDSMPAHLYEPGFVDTVKHELAHHIIDLRCNTPDPPIARNLTEGVTSSYAVLFLGADRDELDLSGYWDPEYFTSDETDEIAQAIRDGKCGGGRN